MTRLIVNGDEQIELVGNTDDLDAVLRAHGYDPETDTVTVEDEYIVRRTSETDYQLEDPTGVVLVETTYQDPPAIPRGIADDIVPYAFGSSSSFDGPAMQELAKMQLLGFRYVDDR